MPINVAFQTDDLDAFDSDYDEAPGVQAVLMANLSSYDSDVISEVPNSDNYQNNVVSDMCVQEESYSEQLAFNLNPDIDNTSDSNIILYEQYLKETENASLTTELERYKERVKTFEQRLNVDLSSREKLINSQMDDMIRNRSVIKQEIDSLKQTLSKQIKEKESLLQTLIVFKKESKEKENKYMDKEIDLEKKIKEQDNIVYKVGQFAQTVHMLIKPQVFYDDTHKQALGYQNLFYLKKAQRIKLTLYDDSMMSKKHDVISVVNEEETFMLAEESRSKMLAKQNNLIVKEKKINISPINYSELNKLAKNFGKCLE
ncbi:hypothetical protein Tco_0524091 [Tanacetum coccineum]